MQPVRSDRPSRRTLESELLAGSAVAFALLAYGALRFPASVTGVGSISAFASGVALLLYAAASLRGRCASQAVRVSLGAGANVGVLLGAAAAAHHYVELFVPLRAPMPVVLGAGMWGLIFLLFGAASAATYRQLGSIGLGVVASVWSSLLSTVMTVTFAVSIALLFLPHMREVLGGAFVTSGMTDPDAFVVRRLFDAASSHLLLIPVVALVSGTASGIACRVLQRISRGAAMRFSMLGLLILAAGIQALGFASSLQRHARPPFIMFGLSSLFVALASAFPLVLAIRHPKADP